MRLPISGATKSVDRFAADRAVTPHVGHLWTPATGNSLARVCETSLPWAADNAAFGDQWDTEAYQKAAFSKIMAAPTRPMFLTVPDVVGDSRQTLDLFHIWHHLLRFAALPLALVLQDGSEDQLLPWDRFDWVFVGGSRRYLGGTWGKGPYVEWKESDAAAGLIREAKRRGKKVHAGRVNGLKRLRHFYDLGVDTCDGSSLSMFPDRWVPRFVDALREFRRHYLGWLRAEVRDLLAGGAASACPKTAGTCREVLGVEPSLWTFAAVAGVEPTNNAAERAVRHAVWWRKTSLRDGLGGREPVRRAGADRGGQLPAAGAGRAGLPGGCGSGRQDRGHATLTCSHRGVNGYGSGCIRPHAPNRGEGSRTGSGWTMSGRVAASSSTSRPAPRPSPACR